MLRADLAGESCWFLDQAGFEKKDRTGREQISGDTFDAFGGHALTCMCCGDRTHRHNCIRNVAWEEANLAGMRPEREKQGLLPVRPTEDGLRETPGDRRPADVWLPRGTNNRPTALDFAVTSGLRNDFWQHVADNPSYVFEQYETFKREFKKTDEHCSSNGFTFQPMIVEAHGGGWSPAARRIWDMISRNQTAAWNDSQESTSQKIAQRLSCSFRLCLGVSWMKNPRRLPQRGTLLP